MAQWQSPCCTSMKTRLLASVSTIQKHMPKPKSQTKTNKTNTHTGQGGMSLQTKCWRAGDRWVPGPAGQAAPPTQQLPGQGEQGRWNDRDRYRLSSGLYMCMHKCAYWPAHLSQATSLRRFMSRKGKNQERGWAIGLMPLSLTMGPACFTQVPSYPLTRVLSCWEMSHRHRHTRLKILWQRHCPLF